MKKKEFEIIITKYFVWFFVNFIICIFPLFLKLVIDGSVLKVFLSFLAFVFTLIITGIYLLGSKSLIDKKEVSFWISIFWSLLIITFYILIPFKKAIENNNAFTTFILENIIYVSCFVLLFTIILSFFLNRPMIQDSIIRAIEDMKMEESKKTQKNFSKNIVNKIQMED